MAEKSFLVTGSTDGIGLQTALRLSRCPQHRVIVHGRSLERCQKAMDYILEECPDAKLDYVVYDFAKMANIPLMANEIKTRFTDLTAIVCNAGVLLPEREETVDGIEMAFQVNHLAHFALVNLLLDTLKRNKPSRIVVVSSICYDWYRMDWDDLMAMRNYQKYAQYSRTKLANHMFAFALARRLENTGVTCNVYEPGVVATKLLRAGGYSSSDEPLTGSHTAVYLVESDEVANVNGCFFNKEQTKIEPSAESSSVELQEKLWQISVQLCNDKGVKLE
ncbi:oxidoreductase, short chain [Trichuris trichiura]|uniref:Oxidoreductase, short chain n=1 Tax=Trichuris trichiura TaxID=36087 RepID=A0A077ZAF4_TRITR|nr:oxidoreductase, short chain [Trichuris trichiura]